MKAICYLPEWPEGSVNEISVLVRAAGIEFQRCNEVESISQERIRDYKLFIVSHKESAAIEAYNKHHPEGLIITFTDKRLSTPHAAHESYLPVECFMSIHDYSVHPREFMTLLAKFQEKSIFGLSRYMNSNIEPVKTQILNFTDKENIIQRMQEYLEYIGGGFDPVRFSEYGRRVSLIVDELVSNAFYRGNERFKEEDPTSLQLSPAEAIDVSWGYDGEHFGFAVRDPYGRLEKEDVLAGVFGTQKRQPIHERTSGGYGLRLVFEYVHNLVINIHPSFYTEVIGLLKLERMIRGADSRLQSFQFFTVR